MGCVCVLRHKRRNAVSSVIHDTHVDDCGTGADDMCKAEVLAEGLVALPAKGGFTVKGFTSSTKPPPP